ncbi:MAG: site-2 protease family protein, partial [Myxococcales bacterium]|nr:site-2 protease family protein [Myxococcales bacterium]
MSRPGTVPSRGRWSWPIGRVRGIDLRVHATFLLLLAWLGVLSWQEHGQWLMVALEVAFTVALFGCVVLHELGHALVARRYGIATRDITLLPIGGVARLERMPTDGWQELWIALAGPAVNVALVVVLLGLMAVVGPVSVLERLALANVALAVFNLLPAFPMDGGRVLRAALAVRQGRLEATRKAVAIGRGFAVVFGLLGLWLNPVLLLIAVFVWFAASGELMDVELHAAAEHRLVADAMVVRFRSLSARESLARALEELLAGTQEDFPVVDGGRVRGMLYKADLMQALAERGEGAPIAAVMRDDLPVLEAREPLDGALEGRPPLRPQPGQQRRHAGAHQARRLELPCVLDGLQRLEGASVGGVEPGEAQQLLAGGRPALHVHQHPHVGLRGLKVPRRAAGQPLEQRRFLGQRALVEPVPRARAPKDRRERSPGLVVAARRRLGIVGGQRAGRAARVQGGQRLGGPPVHRRRRGGGGLGSGVEPGDRRRDPPRVHR